jgi:hypothetical protein
VGWMAAAGASPPGCLQRPFDATCLIVSLEAAAWLPFLSSDRCGSSYRRSSHCPVTSGGRRWTTRQVPSACLWERGGVRVDCIS